MLKLFNLFKQVKYLADLPHYFKMVLVSNVSEVLKYKPVKEPRIAFCLYGVIGGKRGKSGYSKRSSKEILEIGFKYYDRHIFKKNRNIEVFIHTWSTDIERKIKSLYKPKLAIIQKQMIFKIPEYTPGDLQRRQNHYSRWYSTKKVIGLKSKYEKRYKFKYDIVMLSRFDLAWQKDLIFSNFDPQFLYAAKTYSENPILKILRLNLPIGYPYTHSWPGIAELWYFSNSENINKFSNLFDNLDEYTKPSKSLTEKHILTSHFLFYQHLKQTKLLDKLKLIFKHSGYSSLNDEIDPLIRRKFFNEKI